MSDRVSKAKIPSALDALRALDAKELDDVSARDAIRKMRRQIERVLRLGYTYEEVSTTLAGLDINISGERIKYLLNDIRKKTRKKSKVSRDDGVEKNSDEIDIHESSEMKESSELNKHLETNQNSRANQSSEINQTSRVNKRSEAQEISAAPTEPTFTINSQRNNQKSSSVKPDRQQENSKPKNDKNHARDDDTNSFAFQPQLINDEDL
ncbi:hypothetical protein [Brunnivagina elsteri]|uniref:Mobilization protein MobC n=1 Tax=Brunnivagina elsteri CCALA 953 TaxID=987040 RepID=A0A2A2TH20_9CYAN|nr:hypothetical protein [Calothrix elsteri]PAX52925.1 hypothetical protein CK510_16720 [Calothrix elsteri CCALA 953]